MDDDSDVDCGHPVRSQIIIKWQNWQLELGKFNLALELVKTLLESSFLINLS